MNISQKIAELHRRLGKHVKVWHHKKLLGFIPIFWPGGWLSIDEEENSWSVMLTSNKHTHHPFLGSALGADFQKSDGERKIGPGNLTGAWFTILSMWPAKNEDEAVRIFNTVASKINAAYGHRIQRNT